MEAAITIREVRSEADLASVRSLLRNYASEFGDVIRVALERQGFQTEMAGLPGRYAPPAGALLLARRDPDGEPAGCVALRRIDEQACEMKRLYIAPAFRSQGLGKRLATAIVERAGAIGYRRMMLDSMVEMTHAVALYRSLGFREATPYGDTLHALYFERALEPATEADGRGQS